MDRNRRLHRASLFPLPALAWVWLGLAAAGCVLWFARAHGYWEDDAWIHLEFARSLSRGHGFEFNGQVVYGDTSPLWVWLLVGVHALIPDWMAAGKTLTLAAAAVSLPGMFVFARSLAVGNGRPLDSRSASIFAAACVLLLVLNPYFGYWAFSGMEALLALGLVCWAGVGVGPLQVSQRRFLLTAAAAGLAPLLRPEMGFFTVLLGAVLLHRWITLPGEPRKRLGLLGLGFLLACGPAVGWAVYALRRFGSALPTTNAAKRAGPADSVTLRLLHVYGLGFPLVLAGVAWLGWWWLRERQLRSMRGEGPRLNTLLHAGGWLLFFWTAINIAFYIANHTFVQTRYVFVAAPVLTVALLALAAKLTPRLAWTGLAFGCFFGAAISLLATWPLIGNKVRLDRDYADLAAFLRTLPAKAPVAHYSIGEAAFLSEHPLVDTGGITRPGVIPLLWDSTPTRQVFWVHHEGARFWVIDHQPEPGATLVWKRVIPTTGWYLDPRRYRANDLLEVWELPAAPTIRAAPTLPASE